MQNTWNDHGISGPPNCPLIPDNGTPPQASFLTNHSMCWKVQIGKLLQLSDNCLNYSLQGREYIGNWNLIWKIRPSQLPLFRLNLGFEYVCVCMCLLVLYLRICSCSPCVHIAPPILPEWMTDIYAVMRNKPYRISTFYCTFQHLPWIISRIICTIYNAGKKKWTMVNNARSIEGETNMWQNLQL